MICGIRRLLVVIAILTTSALTWGCADALDVSPRTAIAPGDIGEEDIEQLLNGVYRGLQNGPGGYNVILFDMLGGNTIYNFPGRPEQRWIENDVDPGDGTNAGIWVGYYNAIYRANVLLEALDELEETTRNEEIRGITHFLRGYAYYGLVTRYGGVPILRENTRDHVARDSEGEVWAFVEEEFDRAIDLAPTYASNPDYYYATSEAAKALRARTALAQGDMSLAASLAEEVIESGHFSLQEDYLGIFRSGTNSETIFAFENHPDEGVTYSHLFTTVGFVTGGSYFLLPAEDVRDDQLYSDEDRRKEAAFTYDGDQIMANKYITGRQGGDPIQVSRIAEMYLISAEAQGLSGIDRLNELREVRGLSSLDISDEQEYEEAVHEERRKELIFENFRWFDLKRTDRAIEELPHVTSEDQLRLPIPDRELDTNPLLEQNPGY